MRHHETKRCHTGNVDPLAGYANLRPVLLAQQAPHTLFHPPVKLLVMYPFFIGVDLAQLLVQGCVMPAEILGAIGRQCATGFLGSVVFRQDTMCRRCIDRAISIASPNAEAQPGSYVTIVAYAKRGGGNVSLDNFSKVEGAKGLTVFTNYAEVKGRLDGDEAGR